MSRKITHIYVMHSLYNSIKSLIYNKLSNELFSKKVSALMVDNLRLTACLSGGVQAAHSFV